MVNEIEGELKGYNPPATQKEETLEFLKREEIKTMQKDVARLRETEAEKERRKIVTLKPEEEVRIEKEEPEKLKEGEEREKEIEELKKEEEEEKKRMEEEKLEEREREEEERKKIAEEIEKRRREEVIKREEEKKRKILISKEEGEKLEEREEEIKKEVSDLFLKKQPLETKKSELLKEIEEFKIQVEPILVREKKIEERKREIEGKEKGVVSPGKKAKIEKERWQIDKERREVEEEKWKIEEKIEGVKKEIKKVELEFEAILKRGGDLEEERKRIIQRKKEIELEKEKVQLEKKISELIKEREPFEIKKENLILKRGQIEAELQKCLREEKETEEVIKVMEEKERLAAQPKEKREMEKERWGVDKDREVIEKKKWDLEKEKKELGLQLKNVEEDYQKILSRENQIRERIKEINRQLEIGPEEIKEDGEEIEEEIGEKKIEEIKKVEEERIATLKTEEKPRPTPPPPAPAPPIRPQIPPIPLREEEKKIPFETLIPKPPDIRSSFFQKVLVRGVVLLLCLLLLGFFYWFFEVRKPVEEKIIPPAEEKVLPPVEGKPEIMIPPPLIPMQAIRTPEISEIKEIPEIFNRLMKEELPQGSFTQIAIKNLSENRLVSLEEVSTAFQIEVPEEIYQKLEPNYTFTIFAQKQGERVALIAEVKETEGLLELLKNWEKKIKEEGVFISGQKISTQVSYFKSASYQNVNFRYLTISKEDSGICYAWFDDYFVVTTSFESMKKIIEELTFEKKLGQLFIVGFEGKTVTPELENFFKKYKPGGVLLLSKNIEDREQLKNLISDLQNISLKETGLSLFVAIDQEDGLISRIDFASEKTLQSEIENLELAYQIGLKRAEELKELGVNLNLAPLLDFAQEGDFLFSRSFQKDSSQIGILAKSLISGQKAGGILTAIKHFPGYGQISFNPEEELATLEKIPEISQFKKVMEVKPEMVMVSNAIYKEIDPSLPFTFSPIAIQFLKNNLGSEILIISDDLAQNSLLNKFSLKEIVTKPIVAGVDILIFSGWRLPVEQGLDEFLKAFRNGEISKEKIDKAISRVTQLKQILTK